MRSIETNLASLRQLRGQIAVSPFGPSRKISQVHFIATHNMIQLCLGTSFESVWEDKNIMEAAELYPQILFSSLS